VVAERQILAGLEHPNIGRLLDGGGTDDGRPFLVLEYVEGLPIDLYCDRMRLSIRERLKLFLTVLKAVEHAHHNLVVHRDLKPSNILVTPSGEVKLLDFGIAKLLNPTLTGGTAPLTRAQDRALTPEYASPEQVRGEAITTSADIYSLGVVLYQILSGHRPYLLPDGALPEMVRVVCEKDPAPPSQRVSGQGAQPRQDGEASRQGLVEIAKARHTTSGRLHRQLKGDLDAIVMKALRKEPLRRYGSVELLSQDIQYFLDGLAVEARKGSRWYRLGKWARRHRGEAVAATLIFASLVGGGVVVSWQASVASHERDRATSALRESEEVTDFLLGLFQASDPWETPGGEITALDLLGRGVTRANDLGEEPLVQARMLEVMALAHRNLGRFEDEEGLDARVVELLAAERGEDDPTVAQAMVRWGLALSRSGRYDSARVVLGRAHEIQERVLGPKSLELSATLEAQARVDIYLGDLETAEARARESLAMQEEALGPNATPTLNILGVVASILRYQGRSREAEEGFREVLARRRRLASPDPGALSSDLLQIAGMLIDYGGDLGEAEELSREALALQEPGEGRLTLNRVWALTTLAQVAQLRGDSAEAERLLREGVSDRRRTFGDLHPLVAESLGTLGMYLRSVGRLEEAEASLREAVEVNLRTVGRHHTRYAGSLSGLAEVLADRGRLDEADSLALESLEIRRQAQGLGVSPVAETLAVLAGIRLRKGMYESAESYLLQALEIAEDRPLDSPLPRRIHSQLADLYQAMGRSRESARHRTLAAAGS
jgi:serine/threonine-protein kinase